ncbi:hypothetical protein BD31_I0805 [Candidatus Nitrosopumilus salaria BD31]|uniref:Uncharacterized protein n=1 Tax=Candidatus Nitrosopumilus salarius BD31 TaxID=859350 RepID=I3D213_9ARCH|nr:hypothetical protein [Candidatus Nitrosopumilus salaria]EIJ65756.1 hypothetical protein BD31_I0805 [Candidatus Nitrosopumilus salaria BD31]
MNSFNYFFTPVGPEYKKKFARNVGIAVLILFAFYGVVSLIDNVSESEQTKLIGDINSSIPSAQEFLKMDCEDLNHIYPEFPSVEVADAWNTRMHECIDEQESRLSNLVAKSDETKNLSDHESAELETLQKMSCDEIISRNNLGGDYLTKANRLFVKKRLQECDEEMKSTEEYSKFSKLSCDELVVYDGKLDVINSQQVRDYVTREIIDCKNQNY